MSKQFYFKQFVFAHKKSSISKQFSLASVRRLFLFDSLIGSYQRLPLRDRVDLEVMAVKEYSKFPKAPAFLEPSHQIV